ncbi:hypothetical protein [Dissulfurimicrobium hydrothermale]|uniref:hypothetical protein n=1 Tax=Dissulfurimicrobium hydrothermale TaxID=1750598 RepID=UPI003C707DFF
MLIVCYVASMSCCLKQVCADEPKDAKRLFEKKCGICHSIERPKSMRMSRNEWKKTVIRMREHARVFTDAEAEIIIDYLAEHYGR